MWICGICLIRAISCIRIIFNINIGVNPEWYKIFPNTVDNKFLDIDLNKIISRLYLSLIWLISPYSADLAMIVWFTPLRSLTLYIITYTLTIVYFTTHMKVWTSFISPCKIKNSYTIANYTRNFLSKSKFQN